MVSDKIKEAMETIAKAIKEDEGYMRAWYCNIAMPVQDAGVDYVMAQKIASDLLFHFFHADSSEMKREYIKSHGEEIMNPREAVTGFVAWLTTRNEEVILSASDDCTGPCELADKFCNINNLEPVSSAWATNLIHPDDGEVAIAGNDEPTDLPAHKDICKKCKDTGGVCNVCGHPDDNEEHEDCHMYPHHWYVPCECTKSKTELENPTIAGKGKNES